MKPTTYHNLTWIPPMVVGIIAIVLGGGWLFSSEPWMLDQHANEVALQISFSELFSHNINSHLPDYLTIIYRFFGWWVITIGLLLTTFVQVTRMGTPLSRKVIHSVLVIMLIGLYTLEISFYSLFTVFMVNAWNNDFTWYEYMGRNEIAVI